MQKCTTHVTQGRGKIWKLWKFFSKFNQKYDFQQAQNFFCTQNDVIKLILSFLEEYCKIYLFYDLKLLKLWWIFCGNFRKNKHQVAEANQLFACLDYITTNYFFGTFGLVSFYIILFPHILFVIGYEIIEKFVTHKQINRQTYTQEYL